MLMYVEFAVKPGTTNAVRTEIIRHVDTLPGVQWVDQRFPGSKNRTHARMCVAGVSDEFVEKNAEYLRGLPAVAFVTSATARAYCTGAAAASTFDSDN